MPYPAAETTCADEDCGRLAWLSCPEGFCLFHSRYNGRLDAAARTVWDTAREIAQDGDCDFRRWHFPHDPDFDLKGRQGGFFEAKFSGDAVFEGATFSGPAWFAGATFSGDARFRGATFSGDAEFGGAKFGGYASFRGATFSGDAEFGGATFSGGAWFSEGAEFFSVGAEFNGATFRRAARFEDATFSRDAEFQDANFGVEVWFKGTTFSRDAWFRRATFSGAAWFEDATFGRDTWFEGATFSGVAWFWGATFGRDTWFEGATFSGVAWFCDATFSQGAWFQRATFSGEAQFERATFSEGAWFGGATFSGDALFRDATFESAAFFDHTQFKADALFERAHFKAAARFNSSRFAPGCNVYFDTPRRRPLGLLGPKGDRSLWRAARVLAQATGRDALGFFRSTAGGDHSTAEYLLRVGARWPGFLAGTARPFLRRRGGESAYRFAKQAARERGHYTDAGRYHYAEQCAIEDRLMHEAGVGPRLHGLVRLLFARVVFGYGEKVSHPLRLGLVVILACALVFGCIDGVAPDPDSAQTSLGWWQYGYFSVVTFTTLGYGDYRPKQGWPQVLAGFEAALGAVLLGTFVVCLTRKYMR